MEFITSVPFSGLIRKCRLFFAIIPLVNKSILILTAIMLLTAIFPAGCQPAPTIPPDTTAQPTAIPARCILQEWRSISSSLPITNLLAWSHDGKYLAFISAGENNSFDMGDLQIAEAPDFEQPKKLFADVTGGILWSPDDRYIAFNAYRINQQSYTAYLQAIDNSSLIELFSAEEGSKSGGLRRTTVAWLSAEEILLADACGDRCLTPIIYTLTTQNTQTIAPPALEEINGSIPAKAGLVLSAGGYHAIVGVLPEGEKTPRWIAADDEGEPVWESLFSFFPGWMLDSSHIYYLRQPYNTELPYELWVRDQAGGQSTKLLSGVVQAVMSPQKDRMAVISLGRAAYDEQDNFRDFVPNPRQANRVGLAVYDLEKRELLSYQDLGETSTKYIWQNPFLDMFSPAWSPDGKWLIYPDRFSNAWILSLAGGKTAQINLSDQTAVEVKWSPDGKHAAVLLSNKRLVLVDTACLKMTNQD